MSLNCINLCLSNRCNATCIWCPTSRGTKHNFDMPWETAKKIIDELADPAFPNKIRMIHLSENGEALYNKDFLKIARYVKEKLPDTKVNLLSNFGMMSPEISKALLKEKLLSSVQVNIDGHDEETYRAVKGISYQGVIKNVKRFLKYREEFDPKFDFCINVMPAFEYAVTVNVFMNAVPDQINGEIPYSNFDLTLNSLRKFVPADVRIRHSKSGLWAERKLLTGKIATLNVDQSTLDCPMLDRVEHEAFIAPNGDWYPCCLDDNQDIVLGNILESTVLEVFNSEVRKEFIEKLKARRWEEIGYPCNTVACCNSATIKPEIYEKMTAQFKRNDKIIMIKETK
jgi:radical SAM protein with 4Fe4S-binding SPASM domain